MQCLEINLSHVCRCPRSLALHLLIFLHGPLLMPTSQPLSKGIFNHLTVALQHCLGCKAQKIIDFYVGVSPCIWPDHKMQMFFKTKYVK